MVKIGVIGAGGMAAYHVPGFRKGGARVVALADVDPAAAQRAAAAHGIARVYGNADEMLAREDLDAVSVITPNAFHCPLALKALAAGKHVFCEKPPALNAAEMGKMLAAAKRAGKTLMFDFNCRARPESVALKKAIDAGKVGKINSAQAVWIRRTGIPGFGGWFTTKALSGGGPLIDLLHGIDLALYFMGYPEPRHVLACTWDDFIRDRRFRGPWGIPEREDGTCDVEASAQGFVTFADGSALSLRNSWAEMVKREEMSVTFQGRKAGGAIVRTFGKDGFDETATDACELYFQTARGARADRTVRVKKDETMGRLSMPANFVKAIEGKAAPLSTPEQALTLMKIIDAVYASARTRRPVAVK